MIKGSSRISKHTKNVYWFRSRVAAIPKGKGTKRKADEVNTPTPGTPEQVDPQPKKAKIDDNASTPDLPAATSRSGRSIKPKKFADDDLTPSKLVSIKVYCFPCIKFTYGISFKIAL